MTDDLTEKKYSPEELKSAFISQYGKTDQMLKIYSSPARINIIGEHIDYNGGKVMPASINRYLYVAIRKRNDTKVIYNDMRFPGHYEFDINDDFVYARENDYANYLNGILSQLKSRGFKFSSGFEILMVSNIPAGGGISSSSALESGFAFAVSDTFGFNLDRVEIAKLGQMSEHNFMNVKCGIMDQFIISTGKKNTCEILDCNTLKYKYVPLKLDDYRFVVMNTNKVRKLSDSKYNERREQCETALKILQDNGVQIKNLCDLNLSEWQKYSALVTDSILNIRALHCISENERVIKSVNALENENLELLGQLLNESHKSLKENYEVTGIELDTLAETAQKQNGCLGARMTGAGFGGCAIALVHKDQVNSFIENVQTEYTKAIGYKAGFFVCETGDGVSCVE